MAKKTTKAATGSKKTTTRKKTTAANKTTRKKTASKRTNGAKSRTNGGRAAIAAPELPMEEQIRHRAYEIYIRRDQEHSGDPMADWFQAEQELRVNAS